MSPNLSMITILILKSMMQGEELQDFWKMILKLLVGLDGTKRAILLLFTAATIVLTEDFERTLTTIKKM